LKDYGLRFVLLDQVHAGCFQEDLKGVACFDRQDSKLSKYSWFPSLIDDVFLTCVLAITRRYLKGTNISVSEIF
jgi:hypothetical protein